MVRPFLRYPVNHHLAQILERAVRSRRSRGARSPRRPASSTATSPSGPASGPGSAGGSATPGARGSRASSFRAGRCRGRTRTSIRPSIGPARAPTRTSGVSRRGGSGPSAGIPVYGLMEWARTSEADGFFVFHSVLAEGAWTAGPHRLQYRFERTERPEEERIARLPLAPAASGELDPRHRPAGPCTPLGLRGCRPLAAPAACDRPPARGGRVREHGQGRRRGVRRGRTVWRRPHLVAYGRGAALRRGDDAPDGPVRRGGGRGRDGHARSPGDDDVRARDMRTWSRWRLSPCCWPAAVAATAATGPTAAAAAEFSRVRGPGGGNNVPDRFSSDLWVHGPWPTPGPGARRRANGASGNVLKIWSLDAGGAPTLADSIKLPAIIDRERRSGERGRQRARVQCRARRQRGTLRLRPDRSVARRVLSTARSWPTASTPPPSRTSAAGATSSPRGIRRIPALLIYDITTPGTIALRATVPIPPCLRDPRYLRARRDRVRLRVEHRGHHLRRRQRDRRRLARAAGEVSRLLTADDGVDGGSAVHNGWWFHNPVRARIATCSSDRKAPGSLARPRVGTSTSWTCPTWPTRAEVAFFHLDGAGTHNFWMDEARQILYMAYYNGGVVALDVSGTLAGDLSSRLIAEIQPGGAGNTYIWGVQLAGGSLYAIDMLSGLVAAEGHELVALLGGARRGSSAAGGAGRRRRRRGPPVVRAVHVRIPAVGIDHDAAHLPGARDERGVGVSAAPRSPPAAGAAACCRRPSAAPARPASASGPTLRSYDPRHHPAESATATESTAWSSRSVV